MDNRITKRRLSDLLSYDWIIICVLIAALIWAGELIFSIGSVKLTPGQHFKYYLDSSLYTGSSVNIYDLMTEDDTLSYDVLKLDTENVMESYSVIPMRTAIYEGDIMFTDSKANENTKEVKVASYVDLYSMYDFDQLLLDAKKYLRDNFLKDGVTAENAELEYSNLDQEKIKSVFLVRQAHDNRFRSAEQKAEGIELEKARIEKLCEEVKYFETFLNYAKTEEPRLLYRYTKYKQMYETAEEMHKDVYGEMYQGEIDQGRENAIYGINVGFLTGGEKHPTRYVKLAKEGTANEVVMMAFNFKDAQPHLQFEAISFMNKFIRTCSDIR